MPVLNVPEHIIIIALLTGTVLLIGEVSRGFVSLPWPAPDVYLHCKQTCTLCSAHNPVKVCTKMVAYILQSFTMAV